MLRCFIWSIETESKDKEKIIMVDGIILSAGMVFGVVARYFYNEKCEKPTPLEANGLRGNKNLSSIAI